MIPLDKFSISIISITCRNYQIYSQNWVMIMMMINNFMKMLGNDVPNHHRILKLVNVMNGVK